MKFSVYTKKKNMLLFLQLFSILIYFLLVSYTTYSVIINLKWIYLFNIIINIQFILNNQTLFISLIIFIISLYILIYSVLYLTDDINLNKFLGFIVLFTVSMILSVIASNWILFFIGWEFLGIISYLLINYWDFRIEANKGGLKALLWNKLGDIFLLISIISLWFIFKSYLFIVQILIVYFINFEVTYIFFILILAIFIKSVQFILNVWILDAMEGPTPVSAFLHSATMVIIGVYLLFRIAYLFIHIINLFIYILVIIGIITIFLSSLNGIFSYDLKSILASSTSGQIGYMFLAIGFLHNWLFIFHFIIHAFFKSALFLLCGIISHNIKDTQDLRTITFFYKNNPLIYTVLLINLSALIGIPSMISNQSKEFIILIYINKFYIILYLLLLISIVLTILYSIKLFLIFSNTKNTRQKIDYKTNNYLLFILVIPLVCLFIAFYIKFNFILANLNIFNFYLIKSNINVIYLFRFYLYSIIPLIVIFIALIYIKFISHSKSKVKSVFKYSITNTFNDYLYNKCSFFIIQKYLKFNLITNKFLIIILNIK